MTDGAGIALARLYLIGGHGIPAKSLHQVDDFIGGNDIVLVGNAFGFRSAKDGRNGGDVEGLVVEVVVSEHMLGSFPPRGGDVVLSTDRYNLSKALLSVKLFCQIFSGPAGYDGRPADGLP